MVGIDGRGGEFFTVFSLSKGPTESRWRSAENPEFLRTNLGSC
jgi:hypothetical protein